VSAFAVALIGAFGVSIPAAAQSATADSAQVDLQVTDVTFDGRLTFSGRGFGAGEPISVTVEDDQGNVQARLEPAKAEADGQIYRISEPVPGGLAPGAHTLHVTGLTSGRFGHAVFSYRWQSPAVQLEAYTGKPTHALSFSGSGFVPGESVDIYLGEQRVSPLATVTADAHGAIVGDNANIPLIGAGDYTLTFVGRVSQTPTTVGFNVQGFHPWVVLTNYYVEPRTAVGFIGQDFIPGEPVQVFLNSRVGQPVAQVTADADGKFSVQNGFSLPDVTGDNEVIFVGQQSQSEVTTSFTVANVKE
jgi:hypothetical protein